MPNASRHPRFVMSLRFALLAALLATLLVTGGSSRADAVGQVPTRIVAWIVLIVAILFLDAPSVADRRRVRPVTILLAGAVALTLLQLIPLPPALWQALPGRAIFVEAASASGQDQPWRPWSIVPGATVNALCSLIVPVATLVLGMSMDEAERVRLPGLVLSLIVASLLVGLLQFSGATISNPLGNDTTGQVSGLFANRNHFALFIALGCLLAPVWAFGQERRPHWRGFVALGLIPLFVIAILASGSRAGIVVGVLGIVFGGFAIRKQLRAELSRYPRWVFPALVASFIVVIAALVLLSVAADRAVSIDRALTIDPGQDMRRRSLPVVLGMVREYLPWGSGIGGFDPVFRIHEPFSLLKPTYFNHAHNDFLEIVLDAGLPGLALLLSTLVWSLLTGVRAWRVGSGAQSVLPKTGLGIVLLIAVASAFDYPARTPLFMALIVLAGIWLSVDPRAATRSALPQGHRHL